MLIESEESAFFWQYKVTVWRPFENIFYYYFGLVAVSDTALKLYLAELLTEINH
jgi:hypothetical protein